MKKICFLLIFLGAAILNSAAQDLDKNVEQRLKEYFSGYTTTVKIGKTKLENFSIDYKRKTISIYVSDNFAYQPFRPETVEGIYRKISRVLPGPVNYYQPKVYVKNQPIDELVPNLYRKKKKDKSRQWLEVDYKGAPWTQNISRPNEITRGLQGRHISLWQSHGRYFKNEKNAWKWQRPPLFCTTEDLFTQSFVVPYLIPMLESAGAIVFTPRERDIQKNEVVVDNNTPRSASLYLEKDSKKAKWYNTAFPGFSPEKKILLDNENPFRMGTARFTRTEKKKYKAFAEWVPYIPEKGKYAVYVSYQSLPGSVTDAKYTVFHNGGATEFLVNQQIGGGTWVYLGTFEFDQGSHDYCMVVLSNESKQNGLVCADAVRFGGGMGNIARNVGPGGVSYTSGLPRYLEGARYWAQWGGMPYNVYSGKEGNNDYVDDINVRSHMTNYLSGGSVYNPGQKGLGVPFEMSIGIHSDAGFSKEDRVIGTLGIYTTGTNEGRLSSGISRYASRDLADIMLTGLYRDIRSQFDIDWTRRSMWDKNYSETRLPEVPSMILEMLSHQNFTDMRLGHDPNFKFAVSRSIYKSILRFVTSQHGSEYVVQPLPVSHFAVEFGKKKNSVQLSWKGEEDPLEPTAKPKAYKVYTRIGYGGFDNGVVVNSSSYNMKIEPGLVYSFKVTAVNRGGESFPSEILTAYKAKRSKGTVLIINGFDRLSGPATLETADCQGFDLEKDPGVPYLYDISFCGAQTGFNRKNIGKENTEGLGYCGNELENKLIAGNTFDYPFVHGKAIQAAGKYSFASSSDEAVESGRVQMENYPIVDYILGLEKEDSPSSSILNARYKTFSLNMQQHLASYCGSGGNLFISGSYLGSDMNHSPAERVFTSGVLKYTFGASLRDSYSGQIKGLDRNFAIERLPNEKTYAVPAPESLLPVAPAFAVFAYPDGNQSAGIAYRGNYRTFILGFPFESIPSEKDRAYIMSAILRFFSR